ncbi:MAG: EAL domain-containing protein [Coriobacteriales bacterium]|nr:EAL domain-containing protein [Coriobacteriales bacterium]
MPRHLLDVRVDFDELTGLPTMGYFRRYAGAFVMSALARNRTPYIVYFNLENFSAFNERYGFEEGDKLLKLMSVSIQEAFPGYLLSRFGSDHFLLVCESISLEQSFLDVAKQLQVYGRHANIELKAGVYPMEDASLDVALACDRAKLACDSIAHRHDRTVRMFDEALNWRVERGHYIETHIDQAIANEWIEVYYQPIVRTVTGEVCEFEALARWNDPRYGMLSPATFIGVLEECHLIHKLDTYVIRAACKAWRDTRMNSSMYVPFSVNLSRLDFDLCDTFQVVEDATREYGVPRQMVHVEITESALNKDVGALLRVVDRFREAGYQVWLDDFGSGYSSLNTLKDYEFDVVKIDMAFLREFEVRPQSRVIIASIVNMAKQLGMQTLIEGVETVEQFDFLREIGCEFAQGYLIGRPNPSHKNAERIASGELVLADASLHGYYDRMGGINTLSATPFDFPWESSAEERPLAEMLPLALIEYEAGGVRFVSANDSFVSVLRDTQLGTMAQVAQMMSDPQTMQARTMRGLVDAAIASGRIESVDLIEKGHHCMIRMRRVASHGDVVGLMMSVMNLLSFSDIGEETRQHVALKHLYSVYDEVDLINIVEDGMSCVFRGDAKFPTLHESNSASRNVRRFASTKIHPKDQKRFLHHMQYDTVDARLEQSGRSSLIDNFRVLEASGLYVWFTCILSTVDLDEVHYVIVCMRRSNLANLERMDGQNEIEKSLLWDTFIELVPAGVFWKNDQRRFEGVNTKFLDFYEFDSVNDVLGKTDEDMGWHVNDDPFKNIEMRILREGKPVLGSRGTCVSKGEVHNIVASKAPLIRNGETVGLLGFFIDKSDQRIASFLGDDVDKSQMTDELTGILNVRGFVPNMISYAEAYGQTGIDFACIIADIHGMRDLNEVFGHAFGNGILKTVARTLTREYGVDGVVARISGDRFAILQRMIEGKNARTLNQQVAKTVEDIDEVDGIAVRLRCNTGYALFSEFDDAYKTFMRANERVRAS